MGHTPNRRSWFPGQLFAKTGATARQKKMAAWQLFQLGYSEGYEEGLDESWSEGHSEGYREGYLAAFKAASDEAIAKQREQFQTELQRAKLDAMKELAYGASHEINNPLANIALRAQTLLKREDDPDKRKMLEAMHRASMRAHEMISDLMLFARPPAPKKELVSLREVAAKLVAESGEFASERAITVVLLDGKDATAWFDPTQLEVSLRALIDNSLEAIDNGGTIALKVSSVSEEWSEIEVRDNGPGIPAEILSHVFDPFFSGREAGRGLGFGLSKCWRIVTGHGGEVLLDSEPAQGVVVRLVLQANDRLEDGVDSDSSPELVDPIHLG